MLIKRFEGPSMQDVVRRIRAELGPDAIVLSQRTRRAERGWLGQRREHVVEVTAAIDRDRDRVAPPANLRGDARAASENARPHENDRARTDESWRPLQLTRALLEPLEDEIRALKSAVAHGSAGAATPSLAAEMEELRALARELGRGSLDTPVDAAMQPFLRAGLRPELCRSLAADAALRVRDGATELDARLAALSERIEERLAVPRFDVPRSQLVIGAPGVGKTTSLAKLADRYPAGPLRLVSTDVQRPGASARLQAFAAELGVPFEEVRRAGDLPSGSLRGGPVLVDTPGWDASSAAPLAHLDPLRRTLGPQADVQLVVSATTREADLERQVRGSAACEPSSLIVTRVDETCDLSNVINVLLKPGTPRLAWLGCGQGVPEDLALPDAHELAANLLGAVA